MKTVASRPRQFYTFVAFALVAIVVLGFARTYYLKYWTDAAPLSLRLHLHGAFLTLWLLLFVVQVRLIAAGRYRLHQALGIASVVVAVLVIATSYAVAIESSLVRGERGGVTLADRLYSTVLLSGTFALFVGLGIAFRRRLEIHKRFMLMATIAIIAPGMTRAVAVIVGHPVRDSQVLLIGMFILVAMVHDWRQRGRPHWVLWTAGALVIATQLTRRLVGGSETWAEIGNWLLRHT